MEKQAFEYGGFHFIPERRFTAEENSFLAISRRQRLDKELGFCKPGYAYKSKYPYSHESFYAASPDKECDLFRCVENGKLYLPVRTICRNIWNSLKKKGTEPMNDEHSLRRMAGDYEIIQAIHIGDREIRSGRKAPERKR